jgi:hypothetical protein
MNQVFKKVLIVLIIGFNFQTINSQFKSNIHILFEDIVYENGKLTINYSFLNVKEQDNLRVWINIVNSKNDTILVRSWQGDVNKNISGKGKKVAVWDILKDGIDIVDSVTIKISATLENKFSVSDPLVLSAIYPGLGDYKIRPKGPYWMYGAAGYTFLGSGIGLYYNAINSYEKYLGAQSIEDKNQNYNKAVVSRNLSLALIGAAGTIWVLDWLGIINRKNELNRKWRKNPPKHETPSVPGFKISSATSDKFFINSRLTNLKIVEGKTKYNDLDGNNAIDAFEEGFVVFELFNQGPARAVNFYAKLSVGNNNGNIQFPDSVLIGNIPVNQSISVSIPIRASGNLKDGKMDFSIVVSAQNNNPVKTVHIELPTFGFSYQKAISEKDIFSDINTNIPYVPYDGREKFALIVGNEGYANAQTGLSKNFNVPYARHDALVFKNYAVNVLGVKEKNITLLLDAKRKDLWENILMLSEKAKQLKNNAELVFYFAGHGLSDTTTKAPFLIPVDISPKNIRGGISLDSLYKKISDAKSVRNLIIFDAAFNNSGRVMGLRGPKASKIKNRSEVIPSNTVIFSAGWEFSEVYFTKDKGHGLFTYSLLKIIKNSKGKISYRDLDILLNQEILLNANLTSENKVTTTFFSKDISDIWHKWMIRQ